MYTLQAIILDKPVQATIESFGLGIVEISYNLFLIPLTQKYLEANQLPCLPLTDEVNNDIEDRLRDLCLELSSGGKAAYVEAEFFGGIGTQGCAFFEKGQMIQVAQKGQESINSALRWLGISSSESKDEFDVVGLGKYRSTEEWLKE